MITRLFVALWPDATALHALAAWQAHWDWPQGAAVVAPTQLHLTVQLIGAVPNARLPEPVRELALPMPPFELSPGRGELWPKGLAVLCPDAVPDARHARHAESQAALRCLVRGCALVQSRGGFQILRRHS